MLILLKEAWPWLAIGGILIYIGLSLINFSFKDWLVALAGLFFSLFSDNTKTEKQQLAQITLEDSAVFNPGYVILLAGIGMVAYGLIRWVN